jgi:DNA-binding NarL/FixJ family response regulator
MSAYARICRLSAGNVAFMLCAAERAMADGEKPRLTPREREIVEAMLTAASNKDIASRLGITEQSVKNRLTALYRKLGVSGRVGLVVKLMTGDE